MLLQLHQLTSGSYSVINLTAPGYFKVGDDPSSLSVLILIPVKVTVAPDSWSSIVVFFYVSTLREASEVCSFELKKVLTRK